MDKTQVRIYKNSRAEENDFTMQYPCDYCNRFVGQIAKIVNPVTFCVNRICKTCLSETIEMLDKNMQENFQPDFEKSRNVWNTFEDDLQKIKALPDFTPEELEKVQLEEDEKWERIKQPDGTYLLRRERKEEDITQKAWDNIVNPWKEQMMTASECLSVFAHTKGRDE